MGRMRHEIVADYQIKQRDKKKLDQALKKDPLLPKKYEFLKEHVALLLRADAAAHFGAEKLSLAEIMEFGSIVSKYMKTFDLSMHKATIDIRHFSTAMRIHLQEEIDNLTKDDTSLEK